MEHESIVPAPSLASAASSPAGRDERVSSSELASLVDELGDPVVLASLLASEGRFRIRYANTAFARLVDTAVDGLLDRPLDELLSPLARRDVTGELARAARGRLTVSLGDLGRSGRRSKRDFEVTAFPLDGDPAGPASVAFLLRDVTDVRQEQRASERDRKRLEKLVGERTACLEEFHERLRLTERLASIGTLGAGLCHDMNNLLMPIRGHLDAMEALGLLDEQGEHLWSVREAIDYLQQLTNGLRLFALNPDDPEAEAGVVEIPGWWQQLRALLARTIPAEIEFDVEFDDDLPPVGIALHRLTQAALNLLLNAVDSIDGRGRICLRGTAADDKRFVRLAVSDSGRGMSREAQQHALDPFFTTKSRGQSTGLGLSLVHGIVHSAGGRVDIESELGSGTTVTLHLPTASDEVEEAGAARDGGRAVVTINDQRISACFSSFLSSAGFDVDRENDSGCLETAAVWVTDTSGKALAEARRLVDAASSCRIVAYGERSDAWNETGTTVIDRREGLVGIRTAIQQLLLAAEEQ
ncbi:MAG: two-component system sensor histidine kinase NtrB [Planctomycetota bacterium]|jgi:signal transduction histidine kinase